MPSISDFPYHFTLLALSFHSLCAPCFVISLTLYSSADNEDPEIIGLTSCAMLGRGMIKYMAVLCCVVLCCILLDCIGLYSTAF